ncbi:MAG: hypothetical protein V4570_00880 [Pseudomonadota bacterium]
MKSIIYLFAILICLNSISVGASTKMAHEKKRHSNAKKSSQFDPAYLIEIGYPSITMAINAVKERKDTIIKVNNKPFGWQERSGPWFVVKEGQHIEWAFTEGGHYAHPSVIKRIIDVGSKSYVSVDMAFRCEAPRKDECNKLLGEFKEVKTLILNVYRKKFITHPKAVPIWKGVDSLE